MPVVPLAQAAQAAAGGTPILFVDTCALLEIIRFVFRERPALQADLDATRRARAAQGAAPARLLVVTSEHVRAEWLRNQQVLQEAERYVQRVQTETERVVVCGTHLGHAIAARPAMPTLQIPPALHAVADGLLAGSLEIAHSPDILLAASKRLVGSIGPAIKGKDSIGDCVVAETLLHFAAATPAAGRGPLVFLTYNVHDFTNGATAPHADLAADFARLRIQLVTHWTWAAHSLGI